MSQLLTARLNLTPMAEGDFDFLYARWTEPRFCQAMNVEPMSQETVWMRLLRDIGHWQVFGYGNWLVRLKDGTPIGSMGIFDYRRDCVPVLEYPELGWGFDFEFHGQGYAFEALTAALNYADHGLKAPKTVAIIDPDNGPSKTLAARVGFMDVAECLFHNKPVRRFERQNPHV